MQAGEREVCEAEQPSGSQRRVQVHQGTVPVLLTLWACKTVSPWYSLPIATHHLCPFK